MGKDLNPTVHCFLRKCGQPLARTYSAVSKKKDGCNWIRIPRKGKETIRIRDQLASTSDSVVAAPLYISCEL